MTNLELINKIYTDGVNKYKNNYAYIVRLEMDRTKDEEEILLTNKKYTYYADLKLLDAVNKNYSSITSSTMKDFKFKKLIHKSYHEKADIKDYYLIKSNKGILDERSKSNLIHEYFIAINSLNLLKKEIPNFGYILSYIAEENIKISGEDKESKVSYIVYEKIKGISLKSFIDDSSKCTSEIFLQIFSQIILSINTASEKFGFMHNNLTCDNIIIDELPDNIYIHYVYNNKDVYICSKYIPIIINYDKSRIIYRNKVYGYNEPRLNIDSHINYPFSDIYKIFMDCFGYSSYPKTSIKANEDRDLYHIMPNLEVYKILNNLIDYFTNDKNNTYNVYFFIESNNKNHILPYLQNLHVPVYNFFEEMYNRNKNIMCKFTIFSKDVKEYTYGFSGKYDCVINDLNWNSFLTPYKNIINDPYFLLENYINCPNKKIIEDGESKSKIYYNTIYENISNYYDEIMAIPYIDIIKLRNSAPDNLKFKSEFVELYIKYLYKICKIRNILDIIYDEEYLLGILNKMYPNIDPKHDELIAKIYNFVNVYYNQIVNNLKLDIIYFDELDINKYIADYPDIVLIEKLFNIMKICANTEELSSQY